MSLMIVDNLGKSYRTYKSEWHRIGRWLGFSFQPSEEHWVLRNMSFEIQPAEAIGILGQNGAGKSTLLKMITGTMQPTEGSIQVNGRIAAILELGMGFNPELSGRENVFHAAGLMGYSTQQIQEAMPNIEAFAEIGEYLDQPVRTYSSGMQMRVAFSVATAWRPDILIVDEALSVGDSAFQRKCFQRIEGFQEAGTTLLLVSHDIETVKKLCDRAIFIKDGSVAELGNAKEVCDKYERFIFGGDKIKVSSGENFLDQPQLSQGEFDSSLKPEGEMVYGDGQADIQKSWLIDSEGNQINVIKSGVPFRFCYQVVFNKDIENPIFAMMLKTLEGISVYGVDSSNLDCDVQNYKAGDVANIIFSVKNPLAPGVYYLNCGLKHKDGNGEYFLSRRVDTAMIRIISSEETTVISGLTEMNAKLELNNLMERRLQ